MAKSTQAQAAAMIRKELKKHGIKATVKSQSASMMTAVRITVYNQIPATAQKIEDYCNQFQYGSFNGMEDIYEYSNSRDDLPQVKYVTFINEISEEIKDKAWEIVKEWRGYNDNDRHDWTAQQSIRNELNDKNSPVWNCLKTRARVAA